jgi:vacuolar-type H+-ATPase subunit D/Vma8
MRMRDAADALERAVQLEMRRRVGRWAKALELRTVVEGDQRYVLGVELPVLDAARLDRHHDGLAVHLAHVAEARVREALRGKLKIRSEYLVTELGVHGYGYT